MEHLYSMKLSTKISCNYYDLFYLKPQPRTFFHDNQYYFIHLPHLYFWTTSIFSLNKFRHCNMVFGGSNKRIKSIHHNLFLIPIPHTRINGSICVSENEITGPTIQNIHQEVFNAFFSNEGEFYLPSVVGIEDSKILIYMENNTPDMWKNWSENKYFQFSIAAYVPRVLDEINRLNNILQKHAQEI